MDLTPTQSLLSEGAIIAGRYEVVRPLGSGGMGSVLQVLDKALDNDSVALKLLYPHLAHDKVSFARFRNEVLVARRLSHPNIVRLYDIGNAGSGYYFICMEYVPGGSLTPRIYAPPHEQLSFNETLRLLYEIACGIGHAHGMGVVHRDLKPDNILLTERGNIKITDFGLARTLYLDKGFTNTGEAVGTPYYMAPEQLRGDRVDGRCDIYALGLIAFEMVVGRRAFAEESYMALAHLHLRAPIPDFATRESGIPKWYEDFVKRCAEKNPDDRFQSGDEVAEFLKDKIDNMSGKNSPVKRRPAILSFYAPEKRKKQGGLQSYIITLAICAAIAGGGYFTLRQSSGLSGRLYGLLAKVSSHFAAEVDPAQLFAGTERGDKDLVEQVIASGANLESADSQGRTALLYAAELGQSAIAMSLLEHEASPSALDAHQRTPLMLAAKNPEMLAVVNELLRRGADINARDVEMKTSLMYAAESGNELATQALLEHSALLGLRDALGRTALMYAVQSKQPSMVQLVLSRPVDIDAVDNQGRSALFSAVESSETELTEALLAQGADPGLKDKAGRTPLDVATTKNRKLLKAHASR